MSISIPIGTRVTIAPEAKYYNPFNVEMCPVIFTPSAFNSYWVSSFRPDEDNYTVFVNAGKAGVFLVHRNYVSTYYKEEKTMTDKHYEKTYENFVEWANTNGFSCAVESFEQAVEDSKPKPTEVWAAEYYGQIEYLRVDSAGMWNDSSGDVVTDQEEVTPIKKIGVDE